MSLQDCPSPTSPTLETVVSTLTVPNVVFDDAAAEQMQAAGYAVALPAIEATWDQPTSPYVVGIQFEYTPQSYVGQTKLTAPQRVDAGAWVTTDGILPEAVYSCRWRAVGVNNTVGEWLSPAVDVTILSGFSGLAGADGVLDTADLIRFLWKIPPNLTRFDAYVPTNGAAAVVPFTGFGDQQAAYTIPGGAAAVYLTRTAGFGLATRDGAAYNQQFLAKVDSGTATIRLRARDLSNNAITGIADISRTITTTPTVFSWLDFASDDADWDYLLTNAKIEFFTSSTGDIPAGRTVTVTDLMMENEDHTNPHGLTTPWRPSPDEDDLLRYAEILTPLFAAWAAANAGRRVQATAAGAEEYHTLGPRVIRTVSGTSYTLVLDDEGGYVRTTSGSATAITVPPNSAVDFPLRSVISLRQAGAGLLTVAAGVGVTVNPKFGGSLVLAGQYDLVQLLKVGTNEWDMI